jgi:hypothetical protein
MPYASFKLYQITMSYLGFDPTNVYRVSEEGSVLFPVLTITRCRGLKILVDLLDEDYLTQMDLVEHAINGIASVFELQSPTPKNDFCRMFIREGLLDPLTAALVNVANVDQEEIHARIASILLVFTQVSQSDLHVRAAIGTRQIIRRKLTS